MLFISRSAGTGWIRKNVKRFTGRRRTTTYVENNFIYSWYVFVAKNRICCLFVVAVTVTTMCAKRQHTCELTESMAIDIRGNLFCQTFLCVVSVVWKWFQVCKSVREASSVAIAQLAFVCVRNCFFDKLPRHLLNALICWAISLVRSTPLNLYNLHTDHFIRTVHDAKSPLPISQISDDCFLLSHVQNSSRFRVCFEVYFRLWWFILNENAFHRCVNENTSALKSVSLGNMYILCNKTATTARCELKRLTVPYSIVWISHRNAWGTTKHTHKHIHIKKNRNRIKSAIVPNTHIRVSFILSIWHRRTGWALSACLWLSLWANYELRIANKFQNRSICMLINHKFEFEFIFPPSSVYVSCSFYLFVLT